jgi:lysophospholipase L1-like esterase
MEIDIIDSKFGLTFHNTSNIPVVEIDGELVTGDMANTSGSAGYCIAFDYAGQVKKRRLRVSGLGADPAVRGIALTAQGISLKPEASDDTILLLGDSMWDTVTPSASYVPHLTYWIERELGVREVVNMNVGGSGYINANANTYNVPTVIANATNAALIALYNPKHVLINAGFNDRAVSTQPAISAAALSTWQAVRTLLPNAKITVFTGASGSSGPDANALATAATIKAAFATWGDANSRLIESVGTTTTNSYVWGTTHAGQALAAGNSSIWTSTDVSHPSPGGARAIAALMKRDINLAWNGLY